MKKTLLAAALVTGFAGVAHAESSVTLYGIVDAGYGYQQSEAKFKGGDANWNGKIKTNNIGGHSGIQNGSRWGLKGSEDLGNGTSAIFVLESGFDVMNGESTQGGRLFGRQAYVGLTGDSWGTFTIGRQYNAGDTFVAPIDPFGTGWGFAGAENVFGGSVSSRYDSVIKYVTPNFGGFQFGIGVTHNDNEVKYTGGTAVRGDGSVRDYKVINREVGVTTGLSYTSGPLYVGASFDYLDKKYHDHSASWLDTSKHKHERHKTKAWNIGGTYDFDVVKVHLLYGGQKDGTVSNPALAEYGADALGISSTFFGDGYTQHSWLAGLSAPVGDSGKVMFSYAGSTADNNVGNTEWDVTTHNFALGYRHALSKRTSVYGVASYGWSDLDNNRTSHEVETKRAQAIIGLQHRF
jgi:predicted porin